MTASEACTATSPIGSCFGREVLHGVAEGIVYGKCLSIKCVNKIRFTYSQGVEPTICEVVRPNSTKW